MGTFHFKKFDVTDDRSAMKVGTDGVLLGAATRVCPADRNVLDIGTGTGLVAMMLAQRLSELEDGQMRDYSILGIDIDPAAAEEAAFNFSRTPWSAHLGSVNVGLALFESDIEWDLVVSNPPYFDSSLSAPDERRNTARHTGDPEDPTGKETLSYREVLEYSREHLSEGGRVSIVLPADQEASLMRHARTNGFLPSRILRIRTVERKKPSRIVVEFRRRAEVLGTEEETLTLLDEKGKRTVQHASLTDRFYL